MVMVTLWCMWFFLSTLTCCAMHGPLQGAEVPNNPGTVLLNLQYLDDNMVVPIALQHAESEVPYSSSFPAVIQLEHTGCFSNRLEAILAVVRRCRPTDSWTTRPSSLGGPDLPLEGATWLWLQLVLLEGHTPWMMLASLHRERWLPLDLLMKIIRTHLQCCPL